MIFLKGANAAPTSGSIRLALRELGMARRAERLRVTELGHYSSESRPTREVRRADHRGKPSRCLESSKGRYPKWRVPQLVEDSPETGTSTGERRAWKLARGVRRRAGGKGLLTQYLACGLSYWLIGYIGTKDEAEEIKQRVRLFLQNELKLELSEDKTLITHARTETARFLGYHLSTMQANTYRPHGKRYVNGKVELRIPDDVLTKKSERYLKNGKPIHRTELETETAYSIMSRYQSEYRGLVEYYQMANNLNRLGRLRWIMEQSLTKTLSAKLKISVPRIYKRYQTTHIVDGRPYKGLHVIVEREGKQPLIAKWGNIPLRREPRTILNDQPGQVWTGHTELEKRLLADTCELCGSHDRISVHHVRALKDLHQKGRREKPRWMHVMASRRRKTLVVCWSCHMTIQHGRPHRNANNRNSMSLESRIPGNS